MVAVLCLIVPELAPSQEVLRHLLHLATVNRDSAITVVSFAMSSADGRNITEESVTCVSNANKISLLILTQIPISVTLFRSS